MGLRDYQRKAIDEAKAHIEEGRRRPIIVMPTGGGKTCTAAEAAWEHAERGCPVLWVAHRRELVQQAVTTLRRRGCDVGADGLNQKALIQVDSIQYLLASRMLPPASLLVVDEGRHLIADYWRQLAEVYADAILIALDATPERPDGRACDDVYDAMVVACQVSDLLRLNAREPTQGLVPCDVVLPKKSALTPSGVLAPNQIANHPVDMYKLEAPGTQCLCYAPTVKVAAEWAKQFRDAGVKAEYICAKTPTNERDSHIERYKNGDIQVLVNKEILTEGVDLPSTQTILLGRRCPHPSQYVQIVGRGLRPSVETGKVRALLIDLIGNAYMHGYPCEDRKFSLSGIPIEQAPLEVLEIYCRMCGFPKVNGVCERCPKLQRFLPDPKIVGAPMERVEYTEGMKTPEVVVEPKDARIAHLADWLRTARTKNYDPNWARVRFQNRYKYWPSTDIMEKATRLAEGSP